MAERSSRFHVRVSAPQDHSARAERNFESWSQHAPIVGAQVRVYVQILTDARKVALTRVSAKAVNRGVKAPTGSSTA
jgi:hypothetical protein